MARILFCWELGAGLGHMLVHLDLARHLREQGHAVAFALRDLSRAEVVFGREGFTYVQAPVRIRPVADPVPVPRTYTHILHNIGFADTLALTAQAKAWRTLYRGLKPDLLVFDHSPTAMLAARGMTVARVMLGFGFILPPPASPFPDLRGGPAPADWSPDADEDRLLVRINRVADGLGVDHLQRLSDLLQTDDRFLLTFRELDQYPPREAEQYWGDGPRDAGEEPRWPAGEGKRVYAYLKPFGTLPSLLADLRNTGCPTLVYSDELPENLVQEFSAPTLRFVRRPLNLRRFARECDLAVLNANHGTTAAMFLAGRPMLQLPLHLEQLITASNTQHLGIGLSAPLLKPQGMRNKLKVLLESDTFARQAGILAARYQGFDLERRNTAIAERLGTLTS